MCNVDVDVRVNILVDATTSVESAVIGLLTEREFARAQMVAPQLSDYAQYQDWLDAREGLKMGLAMAGVDAKLATVSLSSFLTWCRLTGCAPTERALDMFAAQRPSSGRRQRSSISRKALTSKVC